MHQCIHIRHGDQDSDTAIGERLGHGELIEVAGVVVVNGRPEAVAQVAPAGAGGSRAGQGRQFMQCGRGEVGLQALIKHGPAGNGGQQGPLGVVSGGGSGGGHDILGMGRENMAA